MGPQRRSAAARGCRPTTCRKPALPFATTRDVDVGYARAARGADELRRRSRLRAVRADRPMRDAVRRAVARRRARSACATPATTRSTRCASRPDAARGAPSCRRTRRRCEAGLGYAVTLDKPRLHRPRRAAAPARARASQAPRAVHVRRSGGVSLGRRAGPDGRAPRRRADVGRLQPQAADARVGVRLCAGVADIALTDAMITSARYAIDIAGERSRRPRTLCIVAGTGVRQTALIRSFRAPIVTVLHRVLAARRAAAARRRKPGAETAQVQSLTRGLSILECARAAPKAASRSPTSRSARSCAPSTTHRLLATLEKMGYVYQAGDLGRWYVGLQAFTVGSSFLANRDFVAHSHAYMRRLMEQSGETANLAHPRRHRGGVHRPGAVPRDDAHDRQARQPRAAACVGRGQGDLRVAARRADRRDPQGARACRASPRTRSRRRRRCGRACA